MILISESISAAIVKSRINPDFWKFSLRSISDLHNSSDRPERDPADDSALLFGRTSCRNRSKNNYKILLLTGAQDLLFAQDLLPEQELPNRTESLINNHVELYFACIYVKYLPICIRIELVLSLQPNLAKLDFQVH